MNNKPNIFISHSLHRTSRAHWLNEIHNQLTGSDQFGEVFIDCKGIQTGDAWRKKIFSELGNCHGAIVLLNKEAVEKSTWVVAEACFLFARHITETDFKFIMLTVEEHDDLKSMLKNGLWEPFAFSEMQIGRADEVGDILQQASDLFTGRRWCQNVFGGIVIERISDFIEATHTQEEKNQIVSACETDADHCKFNSWEVANALFGAGLDVYTRYVDILLTSKSFHTQGTLMAKWMINLMAPIWVEPVTSCAMLPYGRLECPKPRVFYLNTYWPDFTVPCYIRSGTSDYTCSHQDRPEEVYAAKWFHIAFDDPGGKDNDTMIDLIRQNIATAIGEKSTSSMRRINIWLKWSIADNRRPVILSLPYSLSQQRDLVEDIQTAFPLLILLIHVEEVEEVLGDVTFLKPHLCGKHENDQYRQYISAKRALAGY